MVKKLTIDSSVIIAGLIENEPKFNEALSILKRIYDREYLIIIPSIVLVEVVGAIYRRIKDSKWTNELKEQLLALPNLKLISIDSEGAIKASEVAVKTGLRGMDSIIVSIAKEFDTELITFDKEMEDKAKLVLG